MEVKTSLLDNMIGVGDMVLLEPLSEESFIANLKNRFDHNEIYVSPQLNVKVTTALMWLNLIWVVHILLYNTPLPVPASQSDINSFPKELHCSSTHSLVFSFFFGYRGGTHTETTASNQSINHSTKECRWCLFKWGMKSRAQGTRRDWQDGPLAVLSAEEEGCWTITPASVIWFWALCGGTPRFFFSAGWLL